MNDLTQLQLDIKPYVDGNGLVSPQVVPPGVMRASDNGTMYLSEYVIMSAKYGKPTMDDRLNYHMTICKCFNTKNNLCRAPLSYDQDSVDNHYGVFAACKILDMNGIPAVIKHGMWSNWGFSNNEVPGTIRGLDGKINWSAFLIRQPQLIAAMQSACGEASWYHFPFYLIAAIVIATSCFDAELADADARRLCWLLIQAVTPDSFWCRLAAKLWYRRLRKQYGVSTNAEGMRKVAALYYQPGHPFIKYWEA